MINGDIVSIFDIATIVVSLWGLIKNIKKILSDTSFVFYLIFFVFYVLPLFLDYFVGFCDYSFKSGYVGFEISRNDIPTVIIYDVFLVYIQLYLIKLAKSTIPESVDYKETRTKRSGIFFSSRFWLLLGGLSPILSTLLILHNPAMLYSFQWREIGLFNDTGSYSSVEKLAYIGISCFSILLFDSYKKTFNLWRVLAIIGIAMCICIQGKRASIFFFVMNAAILLYVKMTNQKIGFKKIAGMLLSIAALVVSVEILISLAIQVKLDRGYDPNREDILYTTTRIDMFRDDRVRMTIYANLHNDMDIIDYPGQTLLTDIAAVVPINYLVFALGLKPYGYQTYFSSALEGTKFNPDTMKASNYSWMTVTFISELMSNIGILLAFILLPFLFRLLNRITFRQRNRYLQDMFVFAFLLMNLFDFTYYVWFLEITVITYLLSHKKYSKNGN